ncbi:MAG: isoprenoid biosynthesis glyoxalase ElbB [Opitutales bacterium]|nr:isoprenoid biosynthesis glyoxalase ElbB [Opitutales bacterium]
MAKKVGIVLSGCGVFDGSEIHESVLTLLALDRADAEAVCMAPNVDQHHVINHLKGEEADDKRNVLVESARIARGEIEDIAGVRADDLDAVIFPGGFGAAKNLCTFAFDGPNATVNPEVERLLKEMFAARKPIGLICISPVIGAKVLGDSGVELTIGNDADTAAGIEATGAKHINCTVTETHEDPERKVVSTPAYMLGKGIGEVADGIEKLVRTVVAWA